MQASAVSPAVSDDSPARIYCFIDDLFFIAKIQETARKLGIKVNFVKNEKDTVAQMLALPEEERPALIVFDLNSVSAKPLTLIPKLKAKLKRATSIVGFLSHLQGELKAKAIEAGCDTVMPRSAFSQTLPNLLRRYGIEVEIEDDQRQIIEA
jgi:CheY-like chemotaxis protein